MTELIFFNILRGSMCFLLQLRRPAYYMLEDEYEEVESFSWIPLIIAGVLVLSFVYFFVRLFWAVIAEVLGVGPFSKYFKNKPENKQLAYAVLGSHMVVSEVDRMREQYIYLLSYLKRLFPGVKSFDSKELQDLHKVYPEPKKITEWCLDVLTQEEHIQLLDFLIDLGFHNGTLNKREMSLIYLVGRGFSISDTEIRAMLNIRHNRYKRANEQKSQQQSRIRSPKRNKVLALKMLGLAANIEDFEIVRKTYRGLARKHHPDRYMNASEEEQKMAHERFTEINLAYEELQKIMGR